MAEQEVVLQGVGKCNNKLDFFPIKKHTPMKYAQNFI